MNNTIKELFISHGVEEKYIETFLKSDKVIFYKEYENGFLSFIEEGDYIILFSAAKDDIYGFSMWKDLISFIDRRTKDIIVCFGKNQDRLYKASKRYDFEKIEKNTIRIKYVRNDR